MHPVAERLDALIKEHGWAEAFHLAIENARASGVEGFRPIRDLDDFLKLVSDIVTYVPAVHGDVRSAFNIQTQYYFILNQEPLRSLQNPIRPGESSRELTPLSAWTVQMARARRSYMNTPDSARGIDAFRGHPALNWDDYMAPPSGYHTFNQFFARHVKPGARPIAALNDDRVLVSPADATFLGSWPIDEDSQLELKGLRWSMRELLQGSPYADRFNGGIFTHSFLKATDYHRWHAPVRGQILEARVIQGQVYAEAVAVPERVDGKSVQVLNVLDEVGFQFLQTRGLIVIDSPVGLVACLPVGMGMVSSVIITAEVGKVLHKGEEMGYFQFGGSDFVMVFQKEGAMKLTCELNTHYKQGSRIGTARILKPARTSKKTAPRSHT